ncbi:MAG: replicative DNA helicase [Candidatus Ratteibacteria bacterium]
MSTRARKKAVGVGLEELKQHVPPHNPEAERALLASMLLDEEAAVMAFENIRADFFSDRRHQVIFEGMQELFEKSRKCDLVTLAELFQEKKEMDRAGGIEYVTSIFDLVPTSAFCEEYIKIVRDKFILRSLISSATEIIAGAYRGGEDIELFLDSAESSIFAVSRYLVKRDAYPLKVLVKESIEMIERIHSGAQSVSGLPTGIIDLDSRTCGLQPSDLIIIASRPSVGKTTFACNIAQRIAIEQKVPVLIFSLEMSKEQIVQRMLCSQAKINFQSVRQGFLNDAEMGRLIQGAGTLSNAPVFIDDTPALTPLEVRARARRLKAKEDIQLVVLDYLQLMRTSSRLENRQQEIAEISSSMKALAKELSIPVVALSQLSRQVVRREDKTPQLADLRESGAIEQDADLVIFLSREEQQSGEDSGKTIVHIAKQRNGPTDQFPVLFLREFCQFREYTRRSDP